MTKNLSLCHKWCHGESNFFRTPHLNQRPLDEQLASFEVHVAPPQRAQLTATSPGSRRQVHELSEAGLALSRRANEVAHLLDVWGREVELDESRWSRIDGLVRAHPSPHLRLTKGSADDGVDLTNRDQRESILARKSLVFTTYPRAPRAGTANHHQDDDLRG